MDAKNVRCFHVGYSETQKAYRLWDPSTLRIRTSRDVVFDENVFYVQQVPISFRQFGYEIDDRRPDRDANILSSTNPTDENCAAEAPASLGGEGGDGPATAGPSNERATVSCQAPSVSIIPCATNSDL